MYVSCIPNVAGDARRTDYSDELGIGRGLTELCSTQATEWIARTDVRTRRFGARAGTQQQLAGACLVACGKPNERRHRIAAFATQCLRVGLC